jgi:glycosyltransferase involved in cell wall biosynthesis
MISALMVSQPSRLALAALAIGDFAAQTHAERELVIVHDGDASDHVAYEALLATMPVPARVLCAPTGLALGVLRNLAVAAARGSHVCQWDDDDRYHPERLALQWRALQEAGAAACFLVDQLHAFLPERLLYWDDWEREPYPMNVVQGTLLAQRDRMPSYPEIARGEDTVLLQALLRARTPIARLRDAGWCYTYVHHGANVFPHAHHAAISRAKRYGAARLLARESLLRARLAEYRPPFLPMRAPHDAGALVFD